MSFYENMYKITKIGFLRKKLAFLRRKNMNFFKIGKGRIFAVEIFGLRLFLKNVFFPPKVSFFQIEVSKLEKLEIFPEESVFIRKTRLQHSKKYLCKNWRPESHPGKALLFIYCA